MNPLLTFPEPPRADSFSAPAIVFTYIWSKALFFIHPKLQWFDMLDATLT